MKALILAAGYGTRLQEMVRDLPKALIVVAKKTILDYLIDQIIDIPDIDGIYLVTNSKFFNHFQDWRGQRPNIKIEILDDQTTTNEERLGAIKDLQLLIERFNINDDVLVCASDTIVQPRLAPFIESFKNRQASWICVRREPDIEDRKQRGIISANDEMRVISFSEKPEHPKSDLVSVPFYIYPKEILSRIKEYLDAGNITDAPGHFVAWLYSRENVYAYNINGNVMDIGNPESLEKARKIFL